jgi:hypothetical protein
MAALYLLAVCTNMAAGLACRPALCCIFNVISGTLMLLRLPKQLALSISSLAQGELEMYFSR